VPTTAGLREIMEAMRDQIDNAMTGPYEIQVFRGIMWNPTPPCIDFWPGSIFRDRASAAFDDISGGYLFTVRCRVTTADVEAGQDLLLRFMDDQDDLCVAAALTDEPTLNGNAATLDVRDLGGWVPYGDPGNEGSLLGFSFTCLVVPGAS